MHISVNAVVCVCVCVFNNIKYYPQIKTDKAHLINSLRGKYIVQQSGFLDCLPQVRTHSIKTMRHLIRGRNEIILGFGERWSLSKL